MQYACLQRAPMTIDDNDAEQMLVSEFPKGQWYSLSVMLIARKCSSDDIKTSLFYDLDSASFVLMAEIIPGLHCRFPG
jgi:hypothetical protein